MTTKPIHHFRVSDKTKSILVLVDVQNGFITDDTRHIPNKIAKYLALERDRFSAVVATRFINPQGSMFEEHMDWTQLRERHETRLHHLIGDATDHILTKTTYSNASAIASVARQYGAQEVWLCGIDTEICVLQTASGLWDLGIRPVVLYDLCASTGGAEAHHNAYDVLRRTVGSAQLLTRTQTETLDMTDTLVPKPIHHFKVGDTVSYVNQDCHKKTVGVVTEIVRSSEGAIWVKCGSDEVWDSLDPTRITLVKQSDFEFVPELGDIVKRVSGPKTSVGVVTRVKLSRETNTIFAFDKHAECLYDSDLKGISTVIENPFGKQFLRDHC